MVFTTSPLIHKSSHYIPESNYVGQELFFVSQSLLIVATQCLLHVVRNIPQRDSLSIFLRDGCEAEQVAFHWVIVLGFLVNAQDMPCSSP